MDVLLLLLSFLFGTETQLETETRVKKAERSEGKGRGEKQKGTSRHSGTEYHEVVTQLWNGVIGGYEPAARGAIPRQRGSRRRKLVEEDRFITRGDGGGGGGGGGGMERGSWPRTGWSQPRYLPFRRSVFARAPPPPPPPSLLLLHLLPPSYPLLQRFILPIEYADEECGGTHRCAVYTAYHGKPYQTVPLRIRGLPCAEFCSLHDQRFSSFSLFTNRMRRMRMSRFSFFFFVQVDNWRALKRVTVHLDYRTFCTLNYGYI